MFTVRGDTAIFVFSILQLISRSSYYPSRTAISRVIVCRLSLNKIQNQKILAQKWTWRMAVYMVERDLPGVTMDQLAAAQNAAIETGKQFTSEGKNVRYIRTAFVPNQADVCVCLKLIVPNWFGR